MRQETGRPVVGAMNAGNLLAVCEAVAAAAAVGARVAFPTFCDTCTTCTDFNDHLFALIVMGWCDECRNGCLD